jgi:hypothetical protein
MAGPRKRRGPAATPDPRTAATEPQFSPTVARLPIADLLAWRCRHGQCVQRPLHDRMDWWPAWAHEARWSA